MPHLLKFGKIFFHRAVHFRGRVPTHWLARLEGVGGQRGNISKGQVHLKIPAPTSEFREYRLRACAHPEADNSVLGGGWLIVGAVNDLRGLRGRARKGGVRDIRAKWLEPKWLEPKCTPT